MDTPYYVVETSGYPIGTTGANKEHEIHVVGPNGTHHFREVIGGSKSVGAKLNRARARALSICAILNAEAR